MTGNAETTLAFEPEEGLWDAKDVAAYLKASRSWVYQKAEAGLLPCMRIGGLLRFEPSRIRAWACGTLPVADVVPLAAAGRR
jgi:excisionase family DNA binding protein